MTLDATRLDDIRYALFNTTAPRYDRLIMPAFGPLAEALVTTAALHSEEVVIDLGAGVGAATFPAGQVARQVIGMDYASAMLPAARQRQGQREAGNVSFYRGDMHRLPHPTHAFSVALAAFAFNGIDPVRVLPEVWRILRPGGRLVFQEWGEVDEASAMVKRTVREHKVKHAEGFLADLRLLGATPKAWDKVGGPDKVVDLLQEVGFQEVKIIREQAAIPLDPHTFYRYKTAWAPYQAELGAMSEAERALVEAKVIEQLSTWTTEDGRFLWQPELVRMIAWK